MSCKDLPTRERWSLCVSGNLKCLYDSRILQSLHYVFSLLTHSSIHTNNLIFFWQRGAPFFVHEGLEEKMFSYGVMSLHLKIRFDVSFSSFVLILLFMYNKHLELRVWVCTWNIDFYKYRIVQGESQHGWFYWTNLLYYTPTDDLKSLSS